VAPFWPTLYALLYCYLGRSVSKQARVLLRKITGTVSATMGSRMVAVGMMPANVDDIVPITVSRRIVTHCGRADSDDNRPLISDDRPDVLSHTHTHTHTHTQDNTVIITSGYRYTSDSRIRTLFILTYHRIFYAIRYDVRSTADNISRLNLPHGTNNYKVLISFQLARFYFPCITCMLLATKGQ